MLRRLLELNNGDVTQSVDFYLTHGAPPPPPSSATRASSVSTSMSSFSAPVKSTKEKPNKPKLKSPTKAARAKKSANSGQRSITHFFSSPQKKNEQIETPQELSSADTKKEKEDTMASSSLHVDTSHDDVISSRAVPKEEEEEQAQPSARAPVGDQGGDVPYHLLASTFDNIVATRSRLEITQLLADMFATILRDTISQDHRMSSF